MKGKLTWDREGTLHYFLDGREVGKEEWERVFPPRPFDASNPAALCGWKRPMLSDALGVNPRQIPAAIDHAKKHGIAAEFAPDGRMVLRDRGQKRDMMKALGLHDNDGGYGDDHATTDHPGYGADVDIDPDL